MSNHDSSLATPEVIEDLVIANRILAMHGVLDAYGHVSVRSDLHPGCFVMSRSRAPALVSEQDLVLYDLDSEPAAGDTRKGFVERYIHGQLYRARPEVHAVVHSHSPSVIPFGVSRTALKPIYHMAAFLTGRVPVFDIRRVRRANDLLVRDNVLGRALARSLGRASCVLMRGHGMTVVGTSIPEAVYHAMYAEMNARLQLQTRLLDGPVRFLSAEEGRIATRSISATIERPWLLWRTEALRAIADQRVLPEPVALLGE
jgi:ribulose-5-phosphate 4-epimerase/fuculose-1-phosphate aldolase